MYTRFMDMHSGGSQKEEFSYLYVELPQNLAIGFFKDYFGHNPEHITCNCCGEDYLIYEIDETLEQVSAYERNCEYDELTKTYLEKPYHYNFGECIDCYDPKCLKTYYTLEQWLNDKSKARLITKSEIDAFYKMKYQMNKPLTKNEYFSE